MNKTILLSLMLVWPTTAGAFDSGPDVGEKIPAFEARDQTGQLRSFEDLKGPEGLLLLFHRTADW